MHAHRLNDEGCDEGCDERSDLRSGPYLAPAVPMPPRAPRGTLRLLALAALLPAFAQAQPTAGAPPDLGQSVLAHLPKPSTPQGSWTQACLTSMDEFRRQRKLHYASPAIETRWLADRRVPGTLARWGHTYLGMPTGSQDILCQDLPYVLRKFQEAAGVEATGIVSERDIEQLSAALRAGQAEQAQAAEAQDQVRRAGTGVTLFGFELGGILPALPSCRFTLADQPTCIAGQPGQGSVDLYFAQVERPSALRDVNVKLGTATAGKPQEWRIMSMSFATSAASLPEFQAKFGSARTDTRDWQNNYGAKWQSTHYTWAPAANVTVGISCGVEFGGGCTASAVFRPPTVRTAPTGRPL